MTDTRFLHTQEWQNSMSEEFIILIIFLVGIVSSYLGAFVFWGVSAFSIALMVATGLSPQLASITFKLGKIGNSIAALKQYHQKKLIRKEFIIGLWAMSFIGAAVGSFFIVQIPDIFIYSVSGISMILLVIIDIYRQKKKWINKEDISLSQIPKKRLWWGYLLEFCMTVLANLSPAASGIYFYFIRTFLFHLSAIESKALGTVLTVPWFLGTCIGIFIAGQYNLIYAIALAIGMYFGAHFGTKKAIDIGDEKIRIFIRWFVIISAIYFLYLAIYRSL
jgi:uncharacterized membrane protein YfcA